MQTPEAIRESSHPLPGSVPHIYTKGSTLSH